MFALAISLYRQGILATQKEEKKVVLVVVNDKIHKTKK